MKLDIRSFFKKKYKTKLEESLDFTDHFNNEVVNWSYSSNLHLLTIELPYTNILKYTTELNKLYKALEEDRIIYNLELPSTYKTITLFDFFLDDEGNYIDIKIAGEHFIEIVNKYLNMYFKLERSLEKSFNTSKNLLTLNQITTYTIELILLIKKVI